MERARENITRRNPDSITHKHIHTQEGGLQRTTSILLATMTRGFEAKRGLMELKREICCLMGYVDVLEMSMKKSTAQGRWARAVMACISMVLRSSSGWSRIPGVSMTWTKKEM